jgi:hypothetical protein
MEVAKLLARKRTEAARKAGVKDRKLGHMMAQNRSLTVSAQNWPLPNISEHSQT